MTDDIIIEELSETDEDDDLEVPNDEVLIDTDEEVGD